GEGNTRGYWNAAGLMKQRSGKQVSRRRDPWTLQTTAPSCLSFCDKPAIVEIASLRPSPRFGICAVYDAKVVDGPG
ncbi:MAG TPA: hypothetical protein DHV57_06095, partial [Hyphomonas sp.]|nr:hypothetical protein [Hyphomonas sp.]